MFRIDGGGAHGAFEVEGEPLLNPAHTGAFGQVEEQDQVQYERRGQDRVAAQEIDFDLHRIAEPPDDIDVIPSFFVVAAGRVIVDADFVVEILIQVGINLGLQDV